MVGIVSYGTYIPVYRIRLSDIAGVWRKNPEEIIRSLGIREKAVPAIDEDAVTIAHEACYRALSAAGVPAGKVGALLVGSESHPYAVNPTSTIVGEMLGIGNAYLAADMEFACKAGTAATQAIAGLIASGQIRYGLAVGSDTAQSKPHDALEYAAGAGGCAFLLGGNDLACELVNYCSYTSDTPDFWRRDGIRFPSHAGRFTGEPAYFTHVLGAAKLLFERTGITAASVDYCVFHMPNGKFPRDAAGRLGFTREQLAPSLVVESIGNPYSASSMLGLAAVLDIAKSGQTVCMVSYGSGAGSDAFLWKVTDRIRRVQKARRDAGATVDNSVSQARYIDYAQYLRQTQKI
ncbi:hydroxymethylglutaryl-CoA synthase [Candidatus Gottesmanbacteria bacterium RBG_16_52_11]|uniref:Hydroxymethylglutaryl-CoA synthase n=1 Tax=Candidatus Gottesmanbacteria bacterium RBG_16_52_11 TaxID=1798374 RepID=A0A1F5YN52_9BACT|nr:MAG: hydroxymethylglutaryl-CoA synthase [Candidatus Gottesmanbacteria bacterium RBG_16_52_11]